jgi:formylglycine-generating enzyme required for sulfatase activity/uncharacterized caspase-like protein
MGKNWAIAIGINNYDNLQSLKYAQRDAEVMATWFGEEAKFDQIFLFTENSPPIPANPPIPTQPTYGRFRRFLNAQFKTPLLNPEDNLWFFFAGHGKRYNDQDYLMFPDSDPTDSTTAISVDYITQRLRRCGADNVVLLLDACRDEGSRGGLGIGEEKHQGVITFYSCNANQQSFEIDELQHGAFTHALLEGLRLQGEGNCATVERLARHLHNTVPQLNTNYRKPIQNPDFKADPPYKIDFILLKRAATFRDAQPLINAAQTAELEGNLLLAKNFWKRLWGLPCVEDLAFAAIERIAQKQSSTNPTSPAPNPATPTGQMSASSIGQEETQRRKQQEAERKRQQQAAEALRREQEAQKQLERTEARKQQQEAERKLQQELDRRRKEQEAEEIRRQQEIYRCRKEAEAKERRRLQIVKRRRFLKWVGFGSGGLVITLATSEFFKPTSSNIPSQAPSNIPSQKPTNSPKQTPSNIPSQRPTNSPKQTPITLSKYNFETVRVVDKKGNIGKPEKKESKLFKENLGNGISLDMVYIPAGSFMMGTEDAEIERLGKKLIWGGYKREQPLHQVNVSAFCIGKYPITQAQWKAVAALTPINRELKPEPSKFKGDNLPVERISWDDAVEFCARLSKHTAKEYRLPSEAEWEYACRAGTTTPFHFGEMITSKLANYDTSYTFAGEVKGERQDKTTPVGQFPANAFGLYDMHGNVWELCLDDWHWDYNKAPTDGSAWKSTNNSNQSKVMRGGSWGNIPDFCRSAFRVNDNWVEESDSIQKDSFGFRVVVVVA